MKEADFEAFCKAPVEEVRVVKLERRPAGVATRGNSGILRRDMPANKILTRDMAGRTITGLPA